MRAEEYLGIELTTSSLKKEKFWSDLGFQRFPEQHQNYEYKESVGPNTLYDFYQFISDNVLQQRKPAPGQDYIALWFTDADFVDDRREPDAIWALPMDLEHDPVWPVIFTPCMDSWRIVFFIDDKKTYDGSVLCLEHPHDLKWLRKNYLILFPRYTDVLSIELLCELGIW